MVKSATLPPREALHTWPTLWVASEEREILHIRPPGAPPRSARVPKGLVHAVNRDTPSIGLATVCGQSLDHLIQFPQYNFEGEGTRASKLVTFCAACRLPNRPSQPAS
jgi:hypothetical protein